MKQVKHVEAGDKIYLMHKGTLREITLTDDHINNLSNITPSFVIDNLRLKSTVVENDQVELEIGLDLDKFFRSSSERGWHFAGESVKAFTSIEALNRFIAFQSNRSELIQSSLRQLNEKLTVYYDEIRKAIEEHVEYVKSIGATNDDLHKFTDYRSINNVNRAIGGKSIFYRD